MKISLTSKNITKFMVASLLPHGKAISCAVPQVLEFRKYQHSSSLSRTIAKGHWDNIKFNYECLGTETFIYEKCNRYSLVMSRITAWTLPLVVSLRSSSSCETHLRILEQVKKFIHGSNLG